ncbi:MAG: GGDEF domain-containing protein [Pseudomonadota bacterium]|nr:GGDEF domain-containing protein [Pseudomonadota bacterium]
MNKAFISTLLITAGMFSFALLALPWVENVSDGIGLIRHYVLYSAIVTTMILSLIFSQTRLFFVLYLTAIFLLLILGDLNPPAFFAGVDEYKFIQLVFLIYLIALVFFLFVKERGVLTVKGIVRLLLCSALPVIPLFLAMNQSYISTSWLSLTIFPVEISQLLSLPDVTVAFYILAMSIMLLALFFRPELVESSFFALLSGAGLALYFFPQMARVEFIFFMALLIVLVFIIRNSFYLAYRDELTGLAGRRSLREQMNKLGSLYSIAMVDIDYFKKFNDRYGHDVGDQVLKMVAGKIAGAGCGSKAYRYGGEEFTLVFPGKSVMDVMSCLETLKAAISDETFIIRGKDRPRNKPAAKKPSSKKIRHSKNAIHVSVSIGIADNQGAGSTGNEVLKISDKALYRAKRKGRNRVSK